MSRLDGLIAVVTGGASGIGRATALAFSREGANVIVADRDAENGSAVVGEITEAGGRAEVRSYDQSVVAECSELIASTVRDYGRLDVLVNCAAVMRMAPTEDVTEESWEEIFRINLLGPFFCGQAALETMRRQRSGRVVNVASLAGMRPYAEHVVYGSLKAATIQLTRIWAVEYGFSGVRVNCVSPGLTETPMNADARSVDPDYEQRFAGKTPAGRMGKAAELAEAIVFLASDDASFAHGTNLVVDGGLDIV